MTSESCFRFGSGGTVAENFEIVILFLALLINLLINMFLTFLFLWLIIDWFIFSFCGLIVEPYWDYIVLVCQLGFGFASINKSLPESFSIQVHYNNVIQVLCSYVFKPVDCWIAISSVFQSSALQSKYSSSSINWAWVSNTMTP